MLYDEFVLKRTGISCNWRQRCTAGIRLVCAWIMQ